MTSTDDALSVQIATELETAVSDDAKLAAAKRAAAAAAMRGDIEVEVEVDLEARTEAPKGRRQRKAEEA